MSERCFHCGQKIYNWTGRPKKVDVFQIQGLLVANRSKKEIADSLGISYSSVCRALKKTKLNEERTITQ